MTGVCIILIGLAFVLGGASIFLICTSTMDIDKKTS